jgi:hypothetical protein
LESRLKKQFIFKLQFLGKKICPKKINEDFFRKKEFFSLKNQCNFPENSMNSRVSKSLFLILRYGRSIPEASQLPAELPTNMQGLLTRLGGRSTA